PLTDVIAQLNNDYAIFPIVLDTAALERAAIPTDTLVTKNLKGVTLGSALKLTLRDHGLAFTVSDEVLLITTEEEANAKFVRRVYPVMDLVRFKDDRGLYMDFDELLTTIHKTIAPGTWN